MEDFRAALAVAATTTKAADAAQGVIAAACILAGLCRKDVERLLLAAGALPASVYKRILSLCKAAWEGGYEAEDCWNVRSDGHTALRGRGLNMSLEYDSKESWQECQAFWTAAINRLANARCLHLSTLEGLLAKPKKQALIKEGTVKAFLAKMDKAMSSGIVDTAELSAVKALLERCRDLM